MAVLVSGGAGYIGSHTVVALHEAGRKVVILDDLSNSSARAVDAIRALTSSDVAFVEGDAADPTTVEAVVAAHGIDEIVHFAAFKAVGESVADPLAYYRNNLGSTVTLAEAAVAHGVPRLVFSSSATVYGEPDEVPIAESAPSWAENPYGWTKFMSERILTDTAAAHPLDVVLLRYFNPIGAHASGTLGEDPNGVPNNLVPYVMQVAVGRLERLSVFGADYDTPDGTCLRDYIHVVDLAEGHVAALEALLAGLEGCTPVNLGTGVGSSVLEVVTAAGEAVGRPIPYEIAPRRPGDVARTFADASRAEELLGWRARRDLATMLADHWRWQRQNPNGYAG